MTESASPPSLNISDLKNLLLIVDAASKRGAFSAKEFTAIGEVYGKVEAFIAASSPPETTEAASETTQGA